MKKKGLSCFSAPFRDAQELPEDEYRIIITKIDT